MEKLKDIKCTLVSLVQEQLKNVKNINAKELGEVVDMIKDLEEAMYYCSIITAMEESKENTEKRSINYYPDMDTHKMYTPYMEYAPYMMASRYQGHDDGNLHSYTSRRMYMESKRDLDSSKSSKELEHYFQDLASEINEMIQGSSLEDKQLLVTKLTWLANKITNSTK